MTIKGQPKSATHSDDPASSGSVTRSRIKALLACSDLLSILTSAAVAFFVLTFVTGLFGLDFVTFERLLSERGAALLSAACCACLYFLFAGHYHMRIPFWEETRAVAVAGLFGLVIEGFLVFAHKADVSRSSMFLSWIIAPFVIMWLRGIVRRTLVSKGVGSYKAVVFGKTDETLRAMDIVASDSHLAMTISAATETTDLAEATKVMSDVGATDAVIALSCSDEAEIRLAADLRRKGYSICVIPPAMGMSASMNVHYILGQDAMLLVSRPEITPRLNRIAKRTFDIVVAGGLLVALGIPMVAVAGVVALDGGSPFFSHRRIGKDGQSFGCLKFRSMRVDAEERLEEYLESSDDARRSWDNSRKLPFDPRITRIGRFIRKASIDELPQLVNVLKGEMSLVGPRPVTAGELDNYGDARQLYTAVKPGLTGMWQVSGRSDLSYARRVALDTWYVENWSPWHDIAILSKTVPVVLGRGGAY
jgi:Undecaprenyl-phosphate galactose phosphotransferase WbaP